MDVHKEPLRILLTGCYAPPYGGASVYVRRLFEYLVKEGHTCHVFDVFNDRNEPGPPGVFRVGSKSRMYVKFLFSPKYDIIHINESMWKHRAALILLARLRGTRSVLTLHSFRDSIDTLDRLNLFMLRYALKHADYIVSPGKKEMENVLEWLPDRKAITVMTPFIPPEMTPAEMELPEVLRAFISRHQTILCANGSNLDFYEGGDIYGLDLMVELCRYLAPDVDAGVVYCLTGANDPAYLDSIRDRITGYGLTDRFLIYTKEVEFWKVIAQSTAFIRPTRTDSFGISVAEGVLLGKPTVASDVCDRPPGAVLFRTGDMKDLYEKTKEALNAEAAPVDRAELVRQLNGAPSIESLYYKLAGRRSAASAE